MKNRKRLLSVFLSLVLALTMCVTMALAVDAGNSSEATITVENETKTVNAGDEVTLDVSIKGNPGYVVFNFSIKYDDSKLELTKVEKGSMAGTLIPNIGTGKVIFDAEDLTQECTENGVLFTLTFKVKALSLIHISSACCWTVRITPSSWRSTRARFTSRAWSFATAPIRLPSGLRTSTVT